MDHASLASPVAELLTTVHLLSGYPAIFDRPEIHRLTQAEIAEKVCHKPCGVRAYYSPDWGILLDKSLKLESDSFDRMVRMDHEEKPPAPAAVNVMPIKCVQGETNRAKDRPWTSLH